MAFTFVGFNTSSYSVGDTYLTVDFAGFSAGDIAFLVVASTGRYISTPPEGWTLLAQNIITGATYSYRELYYKILTQADITTGFADFYYSVSTPYTYTVIAHRGDFNTSDPIDVVSNTIYMTSNTTLRASSMNVANANSIILFFGTVRSTSAKTSTKPTIPVDSWTENLDIWDGDYYGSYMNFNANSLVWSGSGSTGNIDATISLSQTYKHAFAVVLKPSVATSSIKNMTGLAYASMKSVNGLAKASVKSINGLT